MKKFILFIVQIIVTTLVVAILLDSFYTYVFLNNNNRNKIEFVINSNPKKYDVVFLGSSRANNHFDSRIFSNQGLTVYNYGISGSRLEESALLLKLMIEKKYLVKNIILEIDLNINSDGFSNGTRAMFMPYLKEYETIQNHYHSISNFNQLYYIPFYRYINYDSKIGFRELFFSAIKKKNSALNHEGFLPLINDQRPLVATDLSERSPKRNKAYEEIKTICKQNNITLIAMTTPICAETINRDYFNHIHKIYPEIYRMEDTVIDDKYFSTCGHMNEKGAIAFTQIVFDKFFKPKNKS
jgi:hypothetical protein